MSRNEVLIIFALAAVGCSRTPKLGGAKVDIPVFSPSSLEDEHTSTTSDDPHDITKYRTHTWRLSTKDPWEAVDAFYRQKLPTAQRDDETTPVKEDESALDREIRYTWVPEGWKGGAKIMILIDKKQADGTRLEVVQDVLNH